MRGVELQLGSGLTRCFLERSAVTMRSPQCLLMIHRNESRTKMSVCLDFITVRRLAL